MIETLGKQLDWKPSSLENFPELNTDEVHLWWLPLYLNTQQSELAEGWLSDVQREKFHRRATPQLKHTYLAGRYYLLQLLAAYTSKEPSNVELIYSRMNKPSLRDGAGHLQFNFTDTSNGDLSYGLFAFSKSGAVGVDIEHRARSINFDAIVDRRFTEQEQAFVYQNGELNQERCLAIWTRKEAYGKATGRGINFTMKERNLFSGGTATDAHQLAFNDDQQQAWLCLQLELGDEFIASLVHEGHQGNRIHAFSSLDT